MQKYTFYIFGFVVVFLSACCSEISPEYNLVKPQEGLRNILIEEFTGVQCVNCPQGTDEIINLQGLYGKNLISVAIHAGFFAQAPYSDSKYNFLTQSGQAIENWIGVPLGYPSAVVNRTKFAGENSYQLPRPKWAAYVGQLAATSPLVDVVANTTFNPSTRELQISVSVEALADIQNDIRISVMITEDDIIDPQANTSAPGGRTTDYRHRHVLREMLTNFDGNFLTANIKFGDVLTKEYSFTLPPEAGWWDADNVHVVAFVTDASTNAPGEVLNATEVSIIK
jgi:hypothetical protein